MTFLALTIGKSVSGVKSMTPQTRSTASTASVQRVDLPTMSNITCGLSLEGDVDRLTDP